MWLLVMLEGMSCPALMDLLGCCPKYLLHPVGIAVHERIWLGCRRDQICASEEASACMSDGSFLKYLSYRTPYKHEFSTLLNLNAVFFKNIDLALFDLCSKLGLMLQSYLGYFSTGI